MDNHTEEHNAPPPATKAVPQVVPPCPHGLTIAREDFLSPSFSADAFLARWSAASTAAAAGGGGGGGRPRTLETLRDDLGIYLKVLRSAMIELINDDYADFVNLSTNLVGLDKGIAQLEEPLKKYRGEVLEVQSALDETLAALHEKLQRREGLYAKKIALQNLEHITHTLDKVERLLGLSSGSERREPVEMSGDLVERVATEINHLNFCVSKCRASSFVEEMRPRLKSIGDHLHASLESQLLEAVAASGGGVKSSSEVLKRCLRVYATVDRVADAENLVRVRVVRPALEDVVTEKALLDDPLGLAGIFQGILKVITEKLSGLLQLTKSSQGSGSVGGSKHHQKAVRDFDFLGRAFFPEVVEQIDETISAVFSAGNPDKFFSNYRTSMDFLSNFETELGSLEAVEVFRESAAYKTFMGKWNLAVYFQIRFQEIALPVENSLGSLFELSKEKGEEEEGPKFRLEATYATLKALRRCWDSEVYLDALAHRFWKLTLQIVSRYAVGAEQGPEMVFVREPSPAAEPEGDQHHLKASATTANLKEAGGGKVGMTHSRSASFTSAQGGTEQQGSGPKEEKYKSRPSDLIRLWLDVDTLSKYLVEHVLPEVILPRLGVLSEQQAQVVTEGLKEGCQQLEGHLTSLSSLVVSHVSGRCLPYLRQVSDIPRLYRRTNREVPSRACAYVSALLSPAASFRQEQLSVCGEAVLAPWMVSVFEAVAAQFLANVSDVLAAVQKMEESLKRLKRVRDSKTNLAGGGATGDSGKGVSDDDKIRLQLYLDVLHFLSRMRSDFGVDPADVSSSEELLRVVEEATSSAGLAEARKALEGADNGAVSSAKS